MKFQGWANHLQAWGLINVNGIKCIARLCFRWTIIACRARECSGYEHRGHCCWKNINLRLSLRAFWYGTLNWCRAIYWFLDHTPWLWELRANNISAIVMIQAIIGMCQFRIPVWLPNILPFNTRHSINSVSFSIIIFTYWITGTYTILLVNLVSLICLNRVLDTIVGIH